MQQTSIFAYHSLSEKDVNKRQSMVYATLKRIEPATNRMIAEASGIPINVVTPRVGELRTLSKVSEAYKDIDPATGRKAIYWQTIGR